MIPNLFQPHRHIIERILISAIIRNDNAHSAFIVGLSDGLVALLPCGVPDLQLYLLAVYFDGFDFEVYADCGEMGSGEGVVRKAQQKAGLAYPRVPNDQQLYQIVVVVELRPRHSMERVTYGAVSEKNYGQLQKINEVSLPVRYTPSFYHKVVTEHGRFSRFAYFSDYTVAGLTARVEERGDEATVYVMTCCVLPAYRRLKIATSLMQNLIKEATQDPVLMAVYLHVWVSNAEALAFYSNLGFQTLERIENYYENISPPDGFLLCKRLR